MLYLDNKEQNRVHQYILQYPKILRANSQGLKQTVKMHSLTGPALSTSCSCFLKYVVEWQTVYTLIGLLQQEQADLSLHCLHICHFVRNFGVWKFRTLHVSYSLDLVLSLLFLFHCFQIYLIYLNHTVIYLSFGSTSAESKGVTWLIFNESKDKITCYLHMFKQFSFVFCEFRDSHV